MLKVAALINLNHTNSVFSNPFFFCEEHFAALMPRTGVQTSAAANSAQRNVKPSVVCLTPTVAPGHVQTLLASPAQDLQHQHLPWLLQVRHLYVKS